MNKLVLWIVLLMPATVFAQTDTAVTGPITSDYMAKLLLSLGLVVAIIFALAWMVKRFKFLPQHSQGHIKIISTLSISSRDRLALIEVGEEQILIALTPGKIAKLHSLSTPIILNEGADSTFKSKLDSMLKQQKNESKSDA